MTLIVNCINTGLAKPGFICKVQCVMKLKRERAVHLKVGEIFDDVVKDMSLFKQLSRYFGEEVESYGDIEMMVDGTLKIFCAKRRKFNLRNAAG